MIVLGVQSQKYCEVFLKYCVEQDGHVVIRGEKLKHIFNSALRLYPTSSQVLNILHHAYTNGCPTDAITFGHFAAAAYEFELRLRDAESPGGTRGRGKDSVESEAFYQTFDRTNHRTFDQSDSRRRRAVVNNNHFNSISASSSSNHISNHLTHDKRSFTFSGLHNIVRNHEVFLGGSCNPTTWRWEIAIPYFKDNFTTFFNPQKENWTPEMIEIEEQAKSSAKILLFVLDCQTRGIVSMVEVAYLAGARKALLVVLGQKYQSDAVINNEPLKADEVEDLNRGIYFINNFLEKNGLPVFSDMHSALSATSYLLKHKQSPVAWNCESHIPWATVGESLAEIRKAFTELDLKNSGRLDLKDTALALKLLFGLPDRDIPVIFREKLVTNLRERGMSTINLDDFCAICVDFSHFLEERERAKRKKGVFSWMYGSISGILPSASKFAWHRSAPFIRLPTPLKKDVFLGGSCGDTNWRDEVAIPFLLENGLTFYNPQTSSWDTSQFTKEEQLKNASNVLLYYISSSTRSIASMCEAAYFIGQGRIIVLCIVPIGAQGVGKGGMSPGAVKDYKRGRAYLTDIANRHHIPVFADLPAALRKVLEKVQGTWV